METHIFIVVLGGYMETCFDISILLSVGILYIRVWLHHTRTVENFLYFHFRIYYYFQCKYR